jgi:hypothetical protein
LELIEQMLSTNDGDQIACRAEVENLKVKKLVHTDEMVMLTAFKVSVGGNYCGDGAGETSKGELELLQFIDKTESDWAVSQTYIDANCQSLIDESSDLNQIKTLVQNLSVTSNVLPPV